ncbi:ESX secretion-associated protein EspG [Nocardia blacklockiae]|uniref:ESX secretion-associated protein EspG n=1 Tax=Nocardia blacklockiae TaxID=480036 RepID=UPI001894674C|nr:ESX secretion-associated protein EspG [Nocardia blacklockiae]MBF6171405.1 ESX secretion-associated protein EspG [Nocardia blacklockiae]
MNRTWNFSGFEFYVLWRDTTGQRLPWPFFYTNRMQTEDEFEALRLRARERLNHTLDAYFGEVLTALTDPDLWLAVNGWDGHAPDRPDGLVRLYAARRGENGYVVTQTTGETYWDAASFTVTEGDAVSLAAAVVAALPEEKPGRQSDLVLPAEENTDELDYSYGRSAVHDSFDDTVTDRARRFLDTTPVCRGTIDIVQGRSIYGPRGLTRHRLQWRDLPDDGRYLIDDRHPPVVRAADDRQLTSAINTRIVEVVRAIKDERR